VSPLARLEEIEADIAEAERVMTALRLKTAVKRSVREDTTTGSPSVEMMQAWMLLQDQRQRAFEADLANGQGGGVEGRSVIPLASLLVVVPAPSVTDQSAPASRQ
jgi:hypothetical protein